MGVKFSSAADQSFCQVSIDTPVARGVGIGQSAMGNGGLESHVIELSAARAQADFYVGQTLAKSHLRKTHGQKLLPTGEVTNLVVTLVTNYAATALFGVDPFHDLSENGFAEMHEGILGNKNPKENEAKKRSPSPNRSHSVLSTSARSQACYAKLP